ncbi:MULTISPECIES: hypothetical protein [Shouchella]|uniref:Uncharacterized protein n=3 Tax=Bacillaceae TaxID=186817 RepID=A0A060LXP5_9BACI|nr:MULTISPECIES: hypothetical protein [Bacillaceae]RQW20414.1 hypothetical protein EH196_09855 [Bacillus sp. C1-1]AIC94540.1 hypothetical protein BleG1_1962 [Shouchella lehensis G1]KQL51896.1 hypothetical protein AN965_19260 [Alkalicoccobacillus plakortidis]MBG9784563.1 hypothetical protein [Shouchella lehensis]TES50428.1 hypothetical protein E2L03_00395 [Shouchella lehensis]
MSSQDIGFLAFFILCFIVAGIFGGIALASALKGNKKPLYWSIPLALVCVILFIIMMFTFLL